MPTIDRIKIGDRVRLICVPRELAVASEDTRHVFEYCVGGEFTVESFNSYGLAELDVSETADRIVGGFGNSICVELEYLERVSRQDLLSV